MLSKARILKASLNGKGRTWSTELETTPDVKMEAEQDARYLADDESYRMMQNFWCDVIRKVY